MPLLSIREDGRLIIDDGDHILQLDPTTWSVRVISQAHAEAHEQNAYLAVHSALKDTAGLIEVRIGTLNSAKRAHMSVFFETALAATVQMWKDTTKTDEAGNRMGTPNRDFESSNTSGLTICHTPGGTDARTANITRYIGSATTAGKADVGGGGGNRGEFKLKRNAAYLFKITSRADSNALTLFFDWYEHTDK